MRSSNDAREANLGREDRLVRGCVAFSLALMGLFAMVASGRITLVLIGFLALTAYFAITAAQGHDPIYARLGMDTHADEPAAPGAEGTDGQAEWVSALMDR